jgi:hypothetical protein
MSTDPDQPSSNDAVGDSAGTNSKRTPESYTWPLVAIVVVILPQVLVPYNQRVGPPLLVPMVEAAAFLAMFVIAAKPGPVPRGARPFVLSLFSILILANAAATIRLVLLVLDGGKVDGAPLSANRLLIAGAMVLTTNIITFGLLYWQLDSGGPAGRATDPVPYPDFQFPQTATSGLAAPGWQPRVPRLSLSCVHQRARLQPHRHVAARGSRQGPHGDAVGDLALRPRRGPGQGHQHPARLTHVRRAAQPLNHLGARVSR